MSPSVVKAAGGSGSSCAFYAQVLALFRVKPFVLLVAFVGSNLCLVCTIPAVLDDMLRVGPRWYSEPQTDRMVSMYLFVGIGAAAVVAPVADRMYKRRRRRALKRLLVALSALSVVAMAAFSWLLGPGRYGALAACLCCVSFCITSVIPVGIELAADVAFPAPAAAATAATIGVGNAWAFGLVYLTEYLRHNHDYNHAAWAFTVLLALSTAAVAVFDGKLKRSDAEATAGSSSTASDAEQPAESETTHLTEADALFAAIKGKEGDEDEDEDDDDAAAPSPYGTFAV